MMCYSNTDDWPLMAISFLEHSLNYYISAPLLLVAENKGLPMQSFSTTESKTGKSQQNQ